MIPLILKQIYKRKNEKRTNLILKGKKYDNNNNNNESLKISKKHKKQENVIQKQFLN